MEKSSNQLGAVSNQRLELQWQVEAMTSSHALKLSAILVVRRG